MPSIDSTIHPDTLREVEAIARREMQTARDNPRVNPLNTNASNATGDTSAASSKAFQLPQGAEPDRASADPRHPRSRGVRAPAEAANSSPIASTGWPPRPATCRCTSRTPRWNATGKAWSRPWGPAGRFFSYPLDDPTQTNQRNQLVQPMYSAGLFIVQFVTLPYNMVVDPPWEAEYDLGYWRPGDRVPRDMYYFPLTGVGPPLKGNEYGNPKPRKGWFLPILSH